MISLLLKGLLSPFNSSIPNNSEGGYLGLFSNETAINGTQNQFVAVEFDTYQNGWDPSATHVGIDINSIVSNVSVTMPPSINFTTNQSTTNVWVSYDSTSQKCVAYLCYWTSIQLDF